MQKISYKATLILILSILLFSCRNIENNEEFIKLESLVDKDDIVKYNNIILFGTMACQGCVEEQLINFLNEDVDTILDKSLFVLDTTSNHGNIYYKYFKNFIHKDNREIDKKFKRNVNLTVFKIDQNKQEVRSHIINNIDSSLLYYIKNL